MSHYNYGRPPQAEETQRLVKQLLQETREAGGVSETLTIDWRGQPLHLEVINFPISAAYYNPNTHRIRAQRGFDPARDRILEADPWAQASQDYLHYLLQALPAAPAQRDPRFEELKESLQDFGQNSPGLVTRDGVIVDANTRLAAFKELGKSHIRVGVLPESSTWEDINAIELSLQLRKEHRRDYSYINDLLAIDEQVSLGRPLDEVARAFRRRVGTCEQDLWVLSTLRDLISRSTNGTFQLRLLDFEDHKEKLRELQRRYAKESAVNKDNAELMKENRLAAIVLQFAKTDVRFIEPDFSPRYLEKRLPSWFHEEIGRSGNETASVAIPGLNRSVRATSPRVEQAKTLTNMVLKCKAVEAAGDQATPEQVTTSSRVITQMKEAFDKALQPAGKDARLRKRKQAAPDRVIAACEEIDQCVTDLVIARASRSLDEEAFDEAILKLRESLQKLAVETARSIPAPGDGASWLLDACRQEDA
ncbi:hypothetical protein ACQEU3_19845 [Spirillospora sp. CA-253888]